MKIKIRVILLIALIIFIPGCNSAEKNGDGEPRIISPDSNFYSGGELFIDSRQRLNFYDFQSMQSAIICPKPNCPHTEQSGCPSFKMTDCPFIFDNHIYYFDYETAYEKDGSPAWITSLYRADIDGTNRIKINSFKNLRLMYYDRLIIFGGTIYFAPLIISYDENGNVSSLLGAKFCSYSLSDNKLTELFDLGEGYGLNTYLWGAADGEIYLDLSYREEDISFDELMNLLENSEEDISVHKYFKFNIESGELSERDPDCKPIFGGFLCRLEEGGARIYLPEGEIFLDDADDVYDLMTAGGYVFDMKNLLAINAETGEKFALPESRKAAFVYYSDGAFIFKKRSPATGEYEYERLAEGEWQGGEGMGAHFRNS